MNQEGHKNTLSIYLIKEEYSENSIILKNIEKLNKETIRHNDQIVGTLYYGSSHINEPTWLDKFFGSDFENKKEAGESDEGKKLKLFNSSSKAVFLVTVKCKNGKKRTFAIPFGYGWQFLNHGVWEERFGLKVALNIIDPTSLRKIDKKNMASMPKDTSEQLSKAGVAADFGIDIEQDMILSITGNSRDIRFGNIITGKDSLSVTIKINLKTIKEFLKNCYETYNMKVYKKDFGWIDHIAAVKDPKAIDLLNTTLIHNIKDLSLEKTWMAVPEIIDWPTISGFRYSSSTKTDPKNDIHLADFLESLSEENRKNLDLKILKNKRIYCFSAINDEIKYGPWLAYNCLYCEVTDTTKKKTYLLSNGKWYEIEKEFAKQVNSDFQTLAKKISDTKMPKYDHKNENDYNEKVAANDKKLCSMDKKIIRHGGGSGQIEFCDLLSTDKKIIHVKHYGQSSVLSHLFFQGLVSGELMKRDKSFRSKVNKQLSKLSSSHKIENPNGLLDVAKYEIIFAIISKSDKEFNIPFFSKVSLRNTKGKLEAFGYKVSIQKISV